MHKFLELIKQQNRLEIFIFLLPVHYSQFTKLSLSHIVASIQLYILYYFVVRYVDEHASLCCSLSHPNSLENPLVSLSFLKVTLSRLVLFIICVFTFLSLHVHYNKIYGVFKIFEGHLKCTSFDSIVVDPILFIITLYHCSIVIILLNLFIIMVIITYNVIQYELYKINISIQVMSRKIK